MGFGGAFTETAGYVYAKVPSRIQDRIMMGSIFFRCSRMLRKSKATSAWFYHLGKALAEAGLNHIKIIIWDDNKE
jgi:hypothetical protein